MASAVRPCQVELRNEIAPKRTWTVKLERSGGEQALRIPGDIASLGEEAVLRRDSDKVVVEVLVGREINREIDRVSSQHSPNHGGISTDRRPATRGRRILIFRYMLDTNVVSI
jgi:hypothetical protein